jgi:hypothetical protein
MEPSPPLEANSRLASQFHAFYWTWRLISFQKRSATGPYSEPDKSSPHLILCFNMQVEKKVQGILKFLF